MSKINKKVINATKWSSITEIVAKLLGPITTIILARLLTPEAFGVVATVTMIISFTQIFTDAGFNKYLIQHEFYNEENKFKSTTVAFWTNLALSLFLWTIIAIFSNPLARLVGNPGLGFVIIIASASIPFGAFSSIQIALFKRDFDFRTLFFIRMIGIMIPLFVTIPLAVIFKNFWALIIGTITLNLSNAILLTIKSNWKPNLFYSFAILKQMLSFSIWTIIESISIWLTGYVDIFIIGITLNQYYLGIYKTSITTVGQIMGLIMAATTPVLFSSLSRLQQDKTAFKEMFFKFQRIVSLLIMPLGIGIFIYSDLVTKILLGNQWDEASGFIGIWALTSSLTMILSHYSSEVYRSKGKPKLSVLAQFLHIIVLIPTLIIAAQYSFKVLYYSRSLIRFELILVNLILMHLFIKISPWKMIKIITPSFISSVIMGFFAIGLRNMNKSVSWSFFTIILSSMAYLLIIFLFFPKERQLFYSLINKFSYKIKK